MIADMSSRLSPPVAAVEAALQRRLRSGLYQPGDRFMSNRAIAAQYGVSYQTAHRLLRRMVQQGLLRRHDRSGTYVPGPSRRPTHAQLIFHRRANVPGSFGGKLLELVRRQLIDAGLGEPRVRSDQSAIHDHALPVIWEADDVLQRCLEEGRRAIMINDRPAPGLNAQRVDSVATDDFVGGVLAGQYLRRLLGREARYAILAGPRDDRRSQSRVAGFNTEHNAPVVHARTWHAPDAEAVALRLLKAKPAGVFCGNDRLAEGLLRVVQQRGEASPAVVGFDDAPIAETLGLTTIAIPWAALAAGVARIVRDRLNGTADPPTHLVYHPALVLRRERPVLG